MNALRAVIPIGVTGSRRSDDAEGTTAAATGPAPGLAVTVVPGNSLSRAELARWSTLQRADPELAGPFFCPEFTGCAAATRTGVMVAVMRRHGRIVGFFPFERRGRVGGPVGGGRSNYQGAVVDGDVGWSAQALIRASGLHVWEFDHLLASQAPFQPFHRARGTSPFMDLAEGYPAYVRARVAAGSEVVSATERKARKLEREVGPLSFSAQVIDRSVLGALLRLKSDQYRRSGVPDRFRAPHNVRLLELVHGTRTPEFAGVLSALHAGPELVAVHMGMRSRDVWHWWFPAYDPRFARYSPGTIMLLRMAAEAERMGIRVIDLGRHDELYKDRLKSGTVAIAEGRVSVPSLAAARLAVRGSVKSALARGPLARPARAMARAAGAWRRDV